MRAFFLSALLVLPGLLFAQNRVRIAPEQKAVLGEHDHEVHDRHFNCGTPYYTAEAAQKAIENMKRTSPQRFEAMLRDWQQIRLAKTSDDSVGTLQKFFVLNRTTNDFEEVTAKLLAKGTLTQVWADTAEMGNGNVTQAEADAILQTLEVSTPARSRDPQRGVVALETEFFGDPPNRDGDGITDFLLVDVKDGWQPGNNQGFIAGFFFSNDQRNATFSNKRDLLYIDTYPTISFNNNRNVDFALSVTAHEYQHLIHFNYDSNEMAFINEGLSEMAMIVTGYLSESPSLYFGDTDVNLLSWSGELADYSRASLFTLYYAEQVGDIMLKTVVQDPANGTDGLNNALSALNAGIDFGQLFENWCVANYFNDTAFDTRFGYTYPVLGTPTETHNFTDPNQSMFNQTVRGLAVDYVIFSFGDSLRVTFTSDDNVVVKVMKFGQSLQELSDVTLGQEFSVPEFGGTVGTIVFAVINKELSTAKYSYTANGSQQGTLVEIAYDDGTPDRFSGNAAYLSFGNNSAGFGWAVQFKPEVPVNQLVGADLLVVFDQEFQGSNTPADAPKDFLFHVWDDDNGQPGADLITPFIVSTNRTGTSGRDFIEVDLNAYGPQLTNLQTVYIGFTEDDDDTVSSAVGMDNSQGESFSYAFFGPTHSTNPNTWVHMSNLRVGNTPLDGFNAMFRAKFTYQDNRLPHFALGYFQHPIFSEQLDIFVVGDVALSAANLRAKMTQGVTATDLSLQPVSENDDRVFIEDDITLETAGTIQLNVRGTTKYGQGFADTTVAFEVQFLESRVGGRLTSAGGELRMEFPRLALKDDGYLMAYNGNSDILNTNLQAAMESRRGKIYTVSPIGKELRRPATVQIMIDAAFFSGIPVENLAIAEWRSGAWQPLPTQITQDRSALSTEITRLGHLAVIENDATTSVEDAPVARPTAFALHHNYPNPFNPSTRITYDIAEASFVKITIYDILGNEIRTLVNAQKTAGRYTATWDGRDREGRAVSSGVYLYTMTAGTFQQSRKLILTK